jgi:hypothetical protein
MKFIKNAIRSLVAKVNRKAYEIQKKLAVIPSVLAQNRAEGFVDTALKILISVVVGALLLAGLYMLFSDTILPTLTDRIRDLFNYHG